MSPEARIGELERRLAGIVRIGRVSLLDPANARVKVECGPVLTAWLPWVVQRAGLDRTWWAPSVGEQVVVLSPSGDMAMGVVLPSLYRNLFPAPGASPTKDIRKYADGTDIEYDTATGKLTATVVGDVAISAGGKIDATAAGDVTVMTAGMINATSGGDLQAYVGGAMKATVVMETDLACTGAVAVTSATAVSITAPAVSVTAPAITLTGLVTVVGDVQATGKSLMAHTHPYVNVVTPAVTGTPN